MEEVVIDRFIGEFAFLSNFHPSTIYIDGKPYATVEHAYQALKTTNKVQHETIRTAKSPAEAKKLGRSIIMRPDWNDIKVDVMRMLISKKFENPLLREMLLATGDARLVEGNFWNDKFWGVCRGEGLNWLGRLLEEERIKITEERKLEESM